MKLEHLRHVTALETARRHLKDRLEIPTSKPASETHDYCRLKITVEILEDKEYYPLKYTEANYIKITSGEAERLLSMVKKYNEEELCRVENELKDLGVELG